MKEKELAKEIVNFCTKEGISASYNNPYRNKLVSFEIKDKKIICKECGKPK